MTIPTDGTYSGISIYQVVSLDQSSAAIQRAMADLQPLLEGTGLAIPTQFLQPVASDTSVTFSGTSLSFDGYGTPYTLDDAATFAQGPSGFGFISNGAEYVASNGALPDAVTIDQALTTLENYFVEAGNPSALATVQTVKGIVDNLGIGLFSFVTDAGIFDGQPYQPPCFAQGTMILTTDGERPVESLRVGDRVVLARGGEREIVWIGRRRVRIDAFERPELQRPVRVRAGALGGGLPHRDLVVSPDHALFLEGVLVPAGLLVDGSRIRQEAVDQVTYFHVELPQHDVLLADGAPAESYLDTGNRHTFSNASLVSLRPDLSEGEPRIGLACAGMVLGGEALDRIRTDLAAVALEDVRKAS